MPGHSTSMLTCRCFTREEIDGGQGQTLSDVHRRDVRPWLLHNTLLGSTGIRTHSFKQFASLTSLMAKSEDAARNERIKAEAARRARELDAVKG